MRCSRAAQIHLAGSGLETPVHSSIDLENKLWIYGTFLTQTFFLTVRFTGASKNYSVRSNLWICWLSRKKFPENVHEERKSFNFSFKLQPFFRSSCESEKFQKNAQHWLCFQRWLYFNDSSMGSWSLSRRSRGKSRNGEQDIGVQCHNVSCGVLPGLDILCQKI